MNTAATPRRRRPQLLSIGVVLALVAVVLIRIQNPDAEAAAAPAACPAGSTVSIVAHPDDDLFFVNPAIIKDIKAGKCVRTVFLTSGDANDDSYYWMSREAGVLAAYAQMAGVANQWTSGTAPAGGRPVVMNTLSANPKVSTVWMRLPDGMMDGSGGSRSQYASLQKLWSGAITSIRAVDRTATYTLAQLRTAVGAIVTASTPTVIRTLDFDGHYGDGDHSDHYTVAYLAEQIRQQYAPSAALLGYRGYPTVYESANLSAADAQAKSSAYYTYAPFDWRECQTVAACAGKPEAQWLTRSHTVPGSDQEPGQVPPTTTPPTTPPTTTPPTTTPPTSGGTNVAGQATVTASSQNTADGQTAAKAVDGVADGYPGDVSREWATAGGRANSWLNLAWNPAVRVDRVVLHDRPNADDRILAGTLRFSDGSTVAVGQLPNDGSALTVSFPAKSTTSIRFTVTQVSSTTLNIGLAEFQVLATGTTPPTTTPPTTPPTTTPPTTPPTTTPPTTPPTTTPPTTPPTTTPPTTTPPTTPPPGSGGLNVAPQSTATASSQNTADGQTAPKAVDGVADGYPGDFAREWATTGGRANSWLNLAWPSAVQVDRVVLHDRPNADDQILAGTLRFSDGSTVAVGQLPNDGSPLTVSFPAESTTSIRFTITQVSGTTRNVGLAEMQVLTAGTSTPPPTTTNPPTTTPTTNPPTTTTPTTPTTTTPPASDAVNVAGQATVTASSQNTADGQTAAKAVDGVKDGYPGDASREWVTTGGRANSWFNLAWASAVRVDRVVLYDRPNADDRILAGTLRFSDGSTVAVGQLPNDGSALTVSFPAKSTTSIRFTVTQVASTTKNVGLAEIEVFRTA
ncbi:DUF7402 domain-containing protein [Nakamurella leprariae]|uniref:PIG-L family deacetylase n=1 Tax=Nakamurella leprariae TaxID=2803911 RepID=A0A939BY58_9ACTN|nr:PIG-L family deacetylase [Nakamurella leprariae]MBM9466735.1 PIG-L family deacetylase [Nakamurella leprariae]